MSPSRQGGMGVTCAQRRQRSVRMCMHLLVPVLIPIGRPSSATLLVQFTSAWLHHHRLTHEKREANIPSPYIFTAGALCAWAVSPSVSSSRPCKGLDLHDVPDCRDGRPRPAG
ncbi:hypothetical protein B0H11DRAFT_2223630 [Mycena galericulata]|nr:hypothetical protein B0H11DRAFT_2223630 [Mycena galericulata]